MGDNVITLYHGSKSGIRGTISPSSRDECRSPIKDIEIKHILKAALTDEINSREVYMKGIDNSYYYEGYIYFKTEEL